MFKCISFTLFFGALLLIPFYAAADKTGEQIYQQSCAGCHETGTANAPRRADTAFWQTRLIETGSASLLTNTVITGKGAMPANGGCANCTEDELRHAVNYMLEAATSKSPTVTAQQLPLEKLILPKGFSIKIFAGNLAGSRTLARSDKGVIFVGTRGQGKVYALIPSTKPGETYQTVTLLSDLNEPNGVAYHKGDLYVAEIHRITKYENIDAHLNKLPAPVIVYDKLPTEKWHGYRVIHIGPDEKLYTAIGMPCNTCNYRKQQPLFGTISRMTLDGKNLEPYAIGVRNSVGFAWHPKTQELWFTDNGQDLLGDDTPPDEINRAYKQGLDFGFPYVYGDNVIAPGYGPDDIKEFTFERPVYDLQAHVAPLGMTFYTGKQFPKEFQNQMFVALHGSWNRSKKVGYEVVMLTLEGNKVTGITPLVSGFLQNQTGWGRPVDFLILPDGSMLFTDDLNGVIYQVNYAE